MKYMIRKVFSFYAIASLEYIFKKNLPQNEGIDFPKSSLKPSICSWSCYNGNGRRSFSLF